MLAAHQEDSSPTRRASARKHCGDQTESAHESLRTFPNSERTAMLERNVCGAGGQPLKSHESISVANVGLRCYRCFNEETAAMMGVDFDNTPLQPITISDGDGMDHTFEFR